MKHCVQLLLCLILSLALCLFCAVACGKPTSDTNEDIGPTPPSDDALQQVPPATTGTSQTPDYPSAADFSVLDQNGNTVKLSDLIGKPILLNFWATWCPPCKAEMPDLQAAYETYGRDVSFVMVNLTDGTRDTVDVVDQFLQTTGYTFPVYYDVHGSAASAYRVSSIPTTYLINAEGKIVGTHTGMMTAAQIEEALERLLG